MRVFVTRGFIGRRKPKLLIIDALGYLPFERPSAHLFFHLVERRHARGNLLITPNQLATQWGAVFGDEVLAAILDRLRLAQPHRMQLDKKRPVSCRAVGRVLESCRMKRQRVAGPRAIEHVFFQRR